MVDGSADPLDYVTSKLQSLHLRFKIGLDKAQAALGRLLAERSEYEPIALRPASHITLPEKECLAATAAHAIAEAEMRPEIKADYLHQQRLGFVTTAQTAHLIRLLVEQLNKRDPHWVNDVPAWALTAAFNPHQSELDLALIQAHVREHYAASDRTTQSRLVRDIPRIHERGGGLFLGFDAQGKGINEPYVGTSLFGGARIA